MRHYKSARTLTVMIAGMLVACLCAMPLTAPGSQRPDDVYSLVAFLLAENEVIGREAVVDAASLPKIRMPARDHFVRDDRTGGAVFR